MMMPYPGLEQIKGMDKEHFRAHYRELSKVIDKAKGRCYPPEELKDLEDELNSLRKLHAHCYDLHRDSYRRYLEASDAPNALDKIFWKQLVDSCTIRISFVKNQLIVPLQDSINNEINNNTMRMGRRSVNWGKLSVVVGIVSIVLGIYFSQRPLSNEALKDLQITCSCRCGVASLDPLELIKSPATWQKNEKFSTGEVSPASAPGSDTTEPPISSFVTNCYVLDEVEEL